MAKTRLRNDDREAIRDTIIAHKFKPVQAGLDAEAAALAIKVRARAYGAFAKTMDAAPGGAFPATNTVSVNVGGKRVGLKTSGVMRTFYDHQYSHTPMLALSEDDALGVEIMSWAAKAENAKTERAQLREQVRGTLAAFHSFDDLQAGWPEADAFITARWRSRPDYVANVPAVQIAQLTAALDLPPEVAVAA